MHSWGLLTCHSSQIGDLEGLVKDLVSKANRAGKMAQWVKALASQVWQPQLQSLDSIKRWNKRTDSTKLSSSLHPFVIVYAYLCITYTIDK